MEVINYSIKAKIKPGDNNPRNSEGSFIELDNGKIAFAFSRYSGDSDHDDARCDICAVYSDDRGESWDIENYETIVSASDHNVRNVMSVTLMKMANGDIGLYYLVKQLDGTSNYPLRRYGKDFSELIDQVDCIGVRPGVYFVVNNDRVLRCENGDLYIPTSNHVITKVNDVGIREWNEQRATNHFFTSKDDGRTWTQCRGNLYFTDGYSVTGLQEPGIAELKNGTLYAYARTDRMFQYESVSLDGGDSWFGPKASRFTSPCSPMLIKKNPYNGKYYAVWNPVPNYPNRPEAQGHLSWGRTPLVIAESDDGYRFSAPYVLESDPEHGYCYPALYFLDEKNILISYCSGGRSNSQLSQTTLGKLYLK